MISVIIPTLGNFNINNLKYQISNNTEKIPFEIIFCIPQENFTKIVRLKKYQNVKIILSKNHNQVLQRMEAVAKAKYNLILQLDDDISMKELFLTNLYESFVKIKKKLKIKKYFCLSPIYKEKKTNQKLYKKPTLMRKYIYKILFQTDLTKNYGKISSFGLAFDFSPYSNGVDKVEWLPGGCMLTDKNYFKNYNVKEFKNFEKSFYEDVYFSAKSKYHKFIDHNISVYLDDTNMKDKLFLELKYLNKIYKLRKKKNFIKYLMFNIYLCLKKLI